MADEISNDELWRIVLTDRDSPLVHQRGKYRHYPGKPRCKQCLVPLGGAVAPFVRLVTKKAPGRKNPNYCNICEEFVETHPGGAEIELSLLFADVRGSTTLAEQLSPAEFSKILGRFHTAASNIVIDSDGLVDKLVGDEIVALFAPGWAGQEHVRRAMEAGAAILRATGHDDAGEPWLPVGVGVHTGVAYVGTAGLGGMFTDFTALGDPVNATSRLAETARAGELLVSADALAAGQIAPGDLGAHDLELRGRVELLTAYRLDAGATEALLRRSPGATGVRSA